MVTDKGSSGGAGASDGNRRPDGPAGSDRDAARALNSGAIHLLRAMRRVDRLSGLTPARLSALSVLVFGGPCSLGRLARTEDVAGPTMTRIVDGLEAAGLARRTAHPDSARSVLISATDEGTALMHSAADRRLCAIVAALDTLPTSRSALLRAAAPALVELAGVVREQGDAVTDPVTDPVTEPLSRPS